MPDNTPVDAVPEEKQNEGSALYLYLDYQQGSTYGAKCGPSADGMTSTDMTLSNYDPFSHTGNDTYHLHRHLCVSYNSQGWFSRLAFNNCALYDEPSQ